MKPNEISQKRKFALLIIDMLNTFDFPEGESLAKLSLPVAKNILRLKARLAKKKIPVIYLNDNFGQWRSDHNGVYAQCTEDGSPGKEIAEILKPGDSDYFILKPKHSGFFCTNLEILLRELGVKKLIVTGVAGNICVLFTVHDAHMRDFAVWVPRDCVASNTLKDNNEALNQIETVLTAKTSVSTSDLNSFLK